MTLAVIMSMRKRGGLLIVIIGIAIASFLAMDALNSQTGLFGNQTENIIGEVNGKSIPYQDFDNKSRDVQKRFLYFQGLWQNPDFQWTEEQRHELRNYAWDEIVEEYMIRDEYNDIGITVPIEELEARILTPNPIDAVRNFYTQVVDNAPDAMYDVEKMRQVINEVRQITPDDQRYIIKDFYIQLENLLEMDLEKSKYLNLLAKSIYIPSWQAEMDFKQKNNTSDFRFLSLSFDSVKDEEVAPTDDELQAYFDKHSSKYDAKPSRSMEYVIFDILPTAADTATALTYINDKYTRMMKAKNDSAFIRQYAETRATPGYFTAEEIESTIKDTFFVADTGSIFGPYHDNGKFVIAKLFDRQQMADSVKIKHIFTSLQTYGTHDSAQILIDSALGLIAQGVPFDTAAFRLSEDRTTAVNGGDLGWIAPSANLLKSFYKAIFIEHTEGEVFVVRTSVGVHLVELTDTAGNSPRVKVGFLDKLIRPGTETRDSIFNITSRFYTQYNTPDSFDAGIRKLGLTKRYGEDLTGSELNITGVNVPARPVLKWLFESPMNSIKMFREFEGIDNKYVVAHITRINDEENHGWEMNREELQAEVIKEKKATILKDRIATASGGTTDLSQIASKLGVEVNTAEGTGFAIQYIEGLGVEPKAAAVANALSVGQLSGPIVGNNAVFIVEVTNKTEAELPPDWTLAKATIRNGLQSRFGFGVLDQVRTHANVIDYRYKYF